MGDHGRDDALDYHSGGRPGKTEVVPTKPTATQRDLALAYTPGVAKPCLEIEERLKKEMKIPVFHDDQHGTAIISAAALQNALEVAGKKIQKVKVVISGAGAAAMACLRLYIKMGLRKENVILADSHGVIFKGRTIDMTPYKEEFAADTKARTLSEAFKGADVFVGLSVGGIVTKEMVQSMAKDPIVFAMANPDPEIGYEEATAARSDVIMATGRSDFPNQVNNVLGFPFIFRGALDCRATTINEEMKLAASQALAALAKEEVPDSVLRAYATERFTFGRDYLIPKPFDHRVLLNVPPAVARAAAETGVAQEPIADYDAYRRRLEKLLGRARGIMHGMYDRAKRDPKRIVFPEGDQEKIIRAAKILIDEGLAEPILLVKEEVAAPLLKKHNVDRSKITIIDVTKSPKFDEYSRRFHHLRRRRGITATDARRILNSRNYFAMMMVEEGDADGVIAGLHAYYPATVRPALQIIKTKPGVKNVSGAYLLMFKSQMFVLADTTVNIEPDAEQLAEIAAQTAETARRINLEPRIAMISFSNFGSTKHPQSEKVQDAVRLLNERHPELVVDGEMQADTAVVPYIARDDYAWSTIQGDANVLIFPNLDAANAAYKLLWRVGGAEVIGPILQGLAKPVHVLQRGVDVNDIVNMAAIAVIDAQNVERPLLRRVARQRS